MIIIYIQKRNEYVKCVKNIKATIASFYRRYVSIVCPRGYEPRALPLCHPGFKLLRLMVP